MNVLKLNNFDFDPTSDNYRHNRLSALLLKIFEKCVIIILVYRDKPCRSLSNSLQNAMNERFRLRAAINFAFHIYI